MRERDESGKFVAKEETVDYGFYSNLLKKPFASVAELKAAEAEYHKAHDAELKAVEEKKAKAKAIEDAYAKIIAAKKAATERIAAVKKEEYAKMEAAEKEYYALRDAFVKEYGSFHMTYRDTTNGIDFATFVENFWKNLF